jgi:hypothetical protein
MEARDSMKMFDLEPGDIMKIPISDDIQWGIYIGHVDEHPVYRGFCMFIWRLSDDSYSFDALNPATEVDPQTVLKPNNNNIRQSNLMWALGFYDARKPNL